MSAIFRKARASKGPSYPQIVRTEYTNVPVSIPDSFLAPLPDPTTIKVSKINFEDSPLPEYKPHYAVVLDNLLSQEECDQLLVMSEMSVGAHRGGDEPENHGWKPAMVNAGRNHEVLALDYRNSDRIIWDDHVIAQRLWDRVMQAEGMKEYFSILEGEVYRPVCGDSIYEGERWKVTKQGLNERLRFLKYGPGQFFREHCDGSYETEDGSQKSFYTYHLYLNDSAQALGIPESTETDLLRGGATTFHSADRTRRIDVDPRIGRVLIFQHRRLIHSGDEVTAGIKYTMRSDVMFEPDGGSVEVDADGNIIIDV
ncbi:hypothetical protein N431DRAFT_352776 [Stipitochalara longipes BDJ]|nr:hypothetical protein N431DRAFT_352776 [Stipitochalara longipes BDJ]